MEVVPKKSGAVIGRECSTKKRQSFLRFQAQPLSRTLRRSPTALTGSFSSFRGRASRARSRFNRGPTRNQVAQARTQVASPRNVDGNGLGMIPLPAQALVHKHFLGTHTR